MAQARYTGEVWTDARGFAAVVVPRGTDGDLEIEVRALTDGVSADVAGRPNRRRFTITTSEPHVKVAWCIRGALAVSEPAGEESPLTVPRHPSGRGST
jgi:hypothetical protein